jgi:hypothetical protein
LTHAVAFHATLSEMTLEQFDDVARERCALNKERKEIVSLSPIALPRQSRALTLSTAALRSLVARPLDLAPAPSSLSRSIQHNTSLTRARVLSSAALLASLGRSSFGSRLGRSLVGSLARAVPPRLAVPSQTDARPLLGRAAGRVLSPLGDSSSYRAGVAAGLGLEVGSTA